MVPQKLDSGLVYNPVSIDSTGIKTNATNDNLLQKLFSEALFTNLPSDLVHMYILSVLLKPLLDILHSNLPLLQENN